MNMLETDAWLAENVMKWHKAAEGMYFDGIGFHYLINIKAAREELGIVHHECFWSPSTRIQDAFEIERVIEMEGKSERYVQWLNDTISASEEYDSMDNGYQVWFAMAHAAPALRARSAVEVYKETVGRLS